MSVQVPLARTLSAAEHSPTKTPGYTPDARPLERYNLDAAASQFRRDAISRNTPSETVGDVHY